MSHSGFFSTLRSSDHDFIAALRFLDDYAKSVHENGHHHQEYRNFVPRFDLEQHSDAYHLYGELSGFRREDVVIEANDDRNLQVSGSISRLISQPPPSSENDGPIGTKNSAADSQDQKAPDQLTSEKDQSPTHKSASYTGGLLPAADPIISTTTNEERYLNARFGDVLDPHAEFIGGQNDTQTSPKAVNAIPKVRSLISERHPCSFHRAFHFPTPIKKDKVTATMQDGVLHITAPRAPMPPPVKVHVRDELEYYPVLV